VFKKHKNEHKKTTALREEGRSTLQDEKKD